MRIFSLPPVSYRDIFLPCIIRNTDAEFHPRKRHKLKGWQKAKKNR